MKQENELINKKKKGHKIIIHQGPKPKYADIENNLIKRKLTQIGYSKKN